MKEEPAAERVRPQLQSLVEAKNCLNQVHAELKALISDKVDPAVREAKVEYLIKLQPDLEAISARLEGLKHLGVIEDGVLEEKVLPVIKDAGWQQLT